MAYSVLLKKSAEKELELLPTKIHDRVVELLVSLKKDPRPPGSKKLRGREGYRVRTGDYRVLYTVDDQRKEIMIFSVAHRREAYR
ncbi:MAG: type II toxin-antitoxin system RelE/ParE family toxin [Acidobacteria bacterium]|nr:type II toxin-antitoxin system RelE/ParE family toxin [Acidobacteriota bacterium]